MTQDIRHCLEGKTILVAGGGVAGSAFVCGLRKLWDPALKPPTILVVERDARDVGRQRQDYSLSLTGHDDTGGLVTLKKLGVLDRALHKSAAGLDDSGAFKIWTADWREKASFHRKPVPGLPTSTIRITRRNLRQVLHDGMGPDTKTIWGTQCVAAKRLENGRIEVQLRQEGDDTPLYEECDLLVAADGANSKLRAHLRPNDGLEFAGAALRGGLSRFNGPLPKPIDKDWGFALSGDGVSCFYSPVDENTIVWTVGSQEPTPLPPLDRSSEADAKAVIERGRQLGARFSEPFNTIVNHTDLSAVMCINAKDKLPFSHKDIDNVPIVFIGDSNHALTPFSGAGANLALADAWDLAEQLCLNGRSSVAAAVEGYDAVSVPRATKIAKAARRRLAIGHSSGLRLWLFLFMLAVSRWIGMALRWRKR